MTGWIKEFYWLFCTCGGCLPKPESVIKWGVGGREKRKGEGGRREGREKYKIFLKHNQGSWAAAQHHGCFISYALEEKQILVLPKSSNTCKLNASNQHLPTSSSSRLYYEVVISFVLPYVSHSTWIRTTNRRLRPKSLPLLLPTFSNQQLPEYCETQSAAVYYTLISAKPLCASDKFQAGGRGNCAALR